MNETERHNDLKRKAVEIDPHSSLDDSKALNETTDKTTNKKAKKESPTMSCDIGSNGTSVLSKNQGKFNTHLFLLI